MRILSLFLISVLALYANTVGNLTGNLSVSNGALNYNVPLNIPAGTAGVKPDISLHYNSNSGNGYFGQGWSLSGLSTISRCGSNLEFDGVVKGVKYNSEDNICLDGQRLVTTFGTKWKQGSEYKTQIDSYSKIKYDGTNFKVYTKSGDIKEYSFINRVWYLSSVKDRYNNIISYEYSSNSSEVYIKEIIYSDNKIQFNYEDKLDKYNGYSGGHNIQVTKRVDSIDIINDGNVLRSYKLYYHTQSTSNDKSLLKEIKECVGTECLEPLTFDYDYLNNGSFTEKPVYKIGGAWPESSTQFWKQGDFNGDGMTDFAWLYTSAGSANGGSIRTFLSNGDGTFDNSAYTHIRGAWPESSTQFWKQGDFNGDGMTDFVWLYTSAGSANGASMTTFFSKGDGTFTEKPVYKIGGAWPESSTQFWKQGDFNGDGMTDFAWLYTSAGSANGGSIRTFLSNGDGTFDNSAYTHIGGAWPESSTQFWKQGDFNGDGMTDFVWLYTSAGSANGASMTTFFSKGDGTFTEKPVYKIGGAWPESSTQFWKQGDFNGDGMTDFAWLYTSAGSANGGSIRTFLSKGDGTFDNSAYTHIGGAWPESSTQFWKQGDFNGDGMTDFVWLYTSAGSANGASMTTFFSKGDGTFTEKPVYKIGGAWPESSTQFWKQGDFNGDGMGDFVWLYTSAGSANGASVTTFVSSNKKATLNKIEDSFGNETDISYKYLADKTIYTKYTDSNYPNKDLQYPMQVVSSVSSKTGSNDNSITSYTYEGLKANTRGLGSLGFAKITSLNNLNNIKIETNYRQDYPFIGMVDKTTTYMDNDILSEESNTYSGITNSGITRIYQIGSVSKNYQGGTLLSTVTTTNAQVDYDIFGNIKKTSSETIDNTTGEKFKKTIINSYTNDSSSWILGRLKRASVTHEAPGVEPKTKTSSFTYDEITGILKSETIEPDNAKWLKKEYEYDNNGNRVKETIHAANMPSTTTKYFYDSLGKYITSIENHLGHKISKTYDAEGRVKTITDANQLTTSYEYDSFAKKKKETRADGTYTEYAYSLDSSINGSYYKIETKTDGFADTTLYYNSLGAVVASKKVGYKGDIYITQNYDKFGNVVKRSIPYYENETPQYVHTKFDRYNRVIETNNLGVIDTISYDKFTTAYTNSKGQVKTTTKNVLGKVIKVVEATNTIAATITYKYDAIGNLVKTIDPEGMVITLGYDIYGNKIIQNDPDMGTWSYTYNALGQLKTQTDAKGQITLIDYDELGRKKSETLSDGTISTWIYDSTKIGKLHLEKKVSASGTLLSQKVYGYDNYSRLTEVNTTIENKVFSKKYSYDTYGRLKDKTLPNSFKLINKYDDNGYLESIKSPKAQIADFDATHFVNLISDLLNGSSLLYAEYLEYQEKANDLNQTSQNYRALAEQNESDKQDLLSAAEQLEANALDYEAQATASLNLSNQYLSQANSYLAQANSFYSAGNTSMGNHYSSLYNQYKSYSDQKAALSQQHLEAAQSQYSSLDNVNSDIDGKIAQIEYNLKVSQSTATLSEKTSKIAYNLKQRSEQFSADSTTQSAYNKIANDAQHNYFYMALEYNSKDQVVKHISGNGLVNTTTLNSDGTVANIKTGYDHASYIRDLEFEYDSLNNLTTRIDNRLNTVQMYEYDSLNRISKYNDVTPWTSNTISYVYDKSGNIKEKSDVGLYNYKQDTHQVIQAGSKSFTYDANGNVLTNDGTRFEYSPFNKNKKIITSDHEISFEYDMNKQRYKKTQNKIGSTDTTTTYYMDKSYEYISSNSGDKEKYFIYVNGKVISIYTKDISNLSLSNTKYLHYDSLNSIDTITNNIGEVEARMAYRPFGKKIDLDEYGAIKAVPKYTNRGFTGHEHIEKTDFIHMNARVYDPTIGRFMSADTMIPYMYNSQSFNRYSYVRNNPLKYIDPTGHWGFNPAKIVRKVVNAHKKVVKKVAKKIEENKDAIITVAVTAAVVTFAPQALPALKAGTFWSSVALGAMGGAAGGIAGAKLAGASWSDALDAGAKGAVVGAVSAGVAYGVAEGTGSLFDIGSKGHSASFFSGGHTGAAAFKALAHGVSRAAMAKAQGNKTSSAFWSGFTTSGFSVGTKGYGGIMGRTMIMATVSGTVSEVTGGKFSNGAITGAFMHLFNDEAGESLEEWQERVDPPLEDASDIFVAFGLGRLFKIGAEIKINNNLRIAPLGNRTGHPHGKFPHYHRRGVDQQTGQTKPGQGIGRHRPLESKNTDKSFWDKF